MDNTEVQKAQEVMKGLMERINDALRKQHDLIESGVVGPEEYGYALNDDDTHDMMYVEEVLDKVVQEATQDEELQEESCVIPDSASVKGFKDRIKRALIMYIADCENTESIPMVYGFDGFIKYLELLQNGSVDLMHALYKENEFKL